MWACVCMKSNTYELHNYAATLTPNIISSSMKTTAKAKKDNTTTETASKSNSRRSEKYSLRQRQKRRNARTQLEELSYDGTGASLLNSSSDQSSSVGNDGAQQQQQQRRQKSSATLKGTTTIAQAAKANSTSTTTTTATTTSKSKTKAAPLSKYRRKTANARERTRMREINSAFENLRHCVPQPITGDEAANTNEKLTKITTLRLAMKYIGLLSEALTNPGFETDFLLECLHDSSERQRQERAQDEALVVGIEANACALLSSKAPQQQSKQQTKSKTKASRSKSSTTTTTTTTTTPTKRQTASQLKKQMQQQAKKQRLTISSPESAYSGSSIGSGSPSSACYSSSTSPSSAYASALSTHSTPPIISFSNSSASTSPLYNNATNLLDVDIDVDVATNALELNTLLLESDGESLHLSEHCLSPMQARSYSGLLDNSIPALSTQPTTSSLGSGDISMTSCPLEQPDVELSLRLLDSVSNNAHTFDFANDPQQPSSCISPLATLDGFNPFGDLLHTDFTEHTPLDLFLT